MVPNSSSHLTGIAYVPTWACCLLSYHHVPLQKIWLLCILLLGSWGQQWDPTKPSLKAEQPLLRCHVLQPPSHLGALRWICSSLSSSLLSGEAQHWSQHSRQDSPGVSRERTTSLNVLATLLLMQQPGRQLAFFATTAHCCLMVNLLSSRTPRSTSAKLSFLSI